MAGDAVASSGPTLLQLAVGAVLATGAAAAFYYYRIMSPEDRKKMKDEVERITKGGMPGDMSGGMPGMPGHMSSGECAPAEERASVRACRRARERESAAAWICPR